MSKWLAQAATTVALLVLSTAATAADPECLLAGRIDDAGRWAPRAPGVALLDAQGRELAPSDAPTSARRVRLDQPAALSRCDRDRPLARGDGGTTAPGPVPAASPGVLEVVAVHRPPLRVGGTLVELEVKVPPQQRTTIGR